MVIHTIIDEYDLLYAQSREAAYAEKTPPAVSLTDAAAFQTFTKLPEIRKGHSNDNS